MCSCSARRVIGRKVDQWTNLIAAVVFLVAGMAMMMLMQTDLNFLGFTMSTCIVSFVIGLVLFTAGLVRQDRYGRGHTERKRLSGTGDGPDPDVGHRLTAPNPPHGQETDCLIALATLARAPGLKAPPSSSLAPRAPLDSSVQTAPALSRACGRDSSGTCGWSGWVWAPGVTGRSRRC